MKMSLFINLKGEIAAYCKIEYEPIFVNKDPMKNRYTWQLMADGDKRQNMLCDRAQETSAENKITRIGRFKFKFKFKRVVLHYSWPSYKLEKNSNCSHRVVLCCVTASHPQVMLL